MDGEEEAGREEGVHEERNVTGGEESERNEADERFKHFVRGGRRRTQYLSGGSEGEGLAGTRGSREGGRKEERGWSAVHRRTLTGSLETLSCDTIWGSFCGEEEGGKSEEGVIGSGRSKARRRQGQGSGSGSERESILEGGGEGGGGGGKEDTSSKLKLVFADMFDMDLAPVPPGGPERSSPFSLKARFSPKLSGFGKNLPLVRTISLDPPRSMSSPLHVTDTDAAAAEATIKSGIGEMSERRSPLLLDMVSPSHSFKFLFKKGKGEEEMGNATVHGSFKSPVPRSNTDPLDPIVHESTANVPKESTVNDSRSFEPAAQPVIDFVPAFGDGISSTLKSRISRTTSLGTGKEARRTWTRKKSPGQLMLEIPNEAGVGEEGMEGPKMSGRGRMGRKKVAIGSPRGLQVKNLSSPKKKEGKKAGRKDAGSFAPGSTSGMQRIFQGGGFFGGGIGRQLKGSEMGRKEEEESLQKLVMDGPDRFSLLFLEEGEYYFNDYACNYHPQGGSQRIQGHLKVCSASLFFVPKSHLEPIFRLSFDSTSRIERSQNVVGEKGEDFLVVFATERTDVKIGTRHTPYMRHKGEFSFHFSLLYTSLELALPHVQHLLDVAHTPEWEREKSLQVLIEQHEQEVQFNTGWLEDPDEKVILELTGSQIRPLVSQPGRIILTTWSIYFQPFNVVSSAPVVRYVLTTVNSVMRRSLHLKEVGVEVFYSQFNSVYFMFKSPEECTKFHLLLLQQPGLSLENMKTRERWVKDWVNGKVSNFDYLMYLNREANRSFNDLSQYPIFPWVISDYSSQKLDLTNPATFRDLEKPVGALNPERLAKFKERYEELEELYEDWVSNFADGEAPAHVPGTPSPPFLYGCHYSTPGYIVFFRVRDDPQLMLRLQNGRFDMPDRLLSSIPELWEGAYKNPTDLKELIPEFYSLSTSFLVNSEGLDLGTKQSGEVVNHVKLPPWAADFEDFVQKMREALECPYVSRRLHHWINLVFGYKQRGEGAVDADNVFHPLTYDDVGAQVLESITDETVRQAIKIQMREFGRTPKQLFLTPHPRQIRKELRAFHRAMRTAGKVMKLPMLLRHSSLDSRVLMNSMAAFHLMSAKQNHLEKKRRGYKTLLMGALNPLVELALPDRSVYRAIAKVTSNDFEMRSFSVEWLENAAAYREPEMLEISNAKYLAPLLPAATSRKIDQREAAMRALAALALPEPNRAFIYAAGFLPHISSFLDLGYQKGTKAAVEALARLSSLAEVVEEFLTSSVLRLLSLLSLKDTDLQTIDTQAVACKAIANFCVLRRHRLKVVGHRAMKHILPFIKAGEHITVELRENALRALARLCIEEIPQDELVGLGGLRVVLEICGEESGSLLEAALKVLASLSRNPDLRPQIAAEGGLRLLCNASCAAQAPIREVAAEVLMNLCCDGVIINSVVKEEGLWSVIAMALSPHAEVQRLAARAFWHLAVHHENKRQVMAMGGLQSLLHLNGLGEKNPQATLLAEEALKKLAEDDQIQAQLLREEAFLARSRSRINRGGGGGGGGGGGSGVGVVGSASGTGSYPPSDTESNSSPGSRSDTSWTQSWSTSSRYEVASPVGPSGLLSSSSMSTAIASAASALAAASQGLLSRENSIHIENP